MRVSLFITAFVILAFFGMAQKKTTVTIRGTVTGGTKGFDHIMFYTNTVPLDSARIVNGKFEIKIPFTEPYIQPLVTQFDLRGNRGYRPFPLLIDGSGDIQIDMDMAKGLFEGTITGSKTAVAYSAFQKEQNIIYKKIGADIMAIHGKGYAPQNDPLATRISATRDSLMKLYMVSMVEAFVKEHNKEYVGVFVLNMSGRSMFTTNLLESTLKSLSKKMQQTKEVQDLTAYIRGVRNTTIGATVQNFVLNTPEGKPISFDQFKGKYVWIDFWASWCGPCKMAFPHMKELYTKYKDKGLEILGISTDSKTEPWLKILPTLQNPWPQVWDDKNIKSEFAVTAYPTSFLIDPSGKILLREIGYDPGGSSPMDKMLADIFGKSSVQSVVQDKSIPSVPGVGVQPVKKRMIQ